MKEATIKRLAPIVASAAALAYTLLPRSLFGYTATQWNPLRRWLLPTLDSLKSEGGNGYAMYALDAGEHAAIVNNPVREVSKAFALADYTRMPLSALKKNHTGDIIEAASWSKRDSLFAERQTHAMLFDLGDGRTAVYAHTEYNAYNPKVAYKHYRGKGQNYDDGVHRATKVLRAEPQIDVLWSADV